MAQTFKITREELEFLVSYTPSYASLSTSDKFLYTHVMSLLANKPASMIFYFPYQANYDIGNAIPAIKLIRTFTGFGLKQAKDAYEAEQRFTLTEFKVSKEGLMESCKLVTGNSTPLQVIFE